MDDFQARMAEVINRAGGVARLAKSTDISHTAINKYRDGLSDPSRKRLVAIAKATRVSPSWLMTGEGQPDVVSNHEAANDSITPQNGEEMYMATAAYGGANIKLDKASYEARINEVHDSSSVAVPLLNVHASAGGGTAVLSEDADDYIRFSARFLRNMGLEPLQTFLMPVLGDSMEPRIRSGELMLCSRAPHHLKGADGTYIVRLEGDILVKRIQRLPGGKVVVSSENTGYSPFEITLNDGVDFAILGMVLIVFRKV